MRPEIATVDDVSVIACEFPTDRPESDGTMAWDSTTIVLVELRAGEHRGLGYTYGPTAVAELIRGTLRGGVVGADCDSPGRITGKLRASLRNAGQPGIGGMALSAIDIALHDLRARVLGLPLVSTLGAVRSAVPIYGSGGFTSYSPAETARQLAGWVEQGISRVKMKVGREPDEDPPRLAAVREAIGPVPALMVDANGAFTPSQARGWAERYAAEFGVDYFEEPVSSDDIRGLHELRVHTPAGMAIAAGEYAWSRFDVARLLDAEAVDIAQADATRCGGITELQAIDALCAAHHRPLSLHCAPAISAHVGCALPSLVHLEYFHDHIRIEDMLFDGTLSPNGGALRPDRNQPGHGLTLRRDVADRNQVWA